MKWLFLQLLFIASFLSTCSLSNNPSIPSGDDIIRNWDYFPSDANQFQYSGRIDFSVPGKAVFSLPAVKICFRFTGSDIAVHLKDLSSGGIQADGTPARNYFNIYIDTENPFKLGLAPNDTIYLIASGLAKKEHFITLVKRTEALAGKVEFRGAWLNRGARLLNPPEKPSRKIEIIGNSITCGYGVEAGSQNDHFGCSTENVCDSYASLAAEALGAEFHIVAYSGRGVAQNYNCSRENTMPEVWKQIFPDEPQPEWDYSRFIPDITVINLGTNDFNCGETDTALFRSEYAKFLGEVRKAYSATKIVCITGPMLNDNYPENSLTTICYLIQSVINQQIKNGDRNLFFFELSPQTGVLDYGADWHPSEKQQRRNALELTKYLSSYIE